MTDAATDDAPNLDLYGVLGIERTATKQEVHAAYRALARIHHPDVKGGSEKKFNQLRLARDVLSNPSWRANYDTIGEIPPDQADNAQAALLMCMSGMFGGVMHSILSGGKDPCQGDFVAAMLAAIKAAMEGTSKTISGLEASHAQLKAMDGRFVVTNYEQPNHMATILTEQTRQIERQIEQNRATLTNLERARVYLNDVTFTQAPRGS